MGLPGQELVVGDMLVDGAHDPAALLEQPLVRPVWVDLQYKARLRSALPNGLLGDNDHKAFSCPNQNMGQRGFPKFDYYILF